MSPEIAIALIRPGLLGTYGDRGNATVLAERLRRRGISARVLDLDRGPVPTEADLYLLGGGEDGAQSSVAADAQLREALHGAVARGAVVLGVCAGFQLLGNSFETGDGEQVAGFGILDCKSARRDAPRAVGEVFSQPRAELGLPTLTGFENHGGGTWLGPGLAPLGRLELGVGNGDGSGTEGAISGHVVATYLHGPVLARNPALADILLGWAVGKTLEPLPMPAVDRLRAERLAEPRGEQDARVSRGDAADATDASAALREFDLTDLDLFADGFPHAVFALHRAVAPVSWHDPTAHTPDNEGFWSVATHAETLAVMRDPRTYSSETGGARPYGGTIIPDSPIAGRILNMMDDPRHQRVRALVSRGLTPRTIGRLEADLRARTRRLLDAFAATGGGDFVAGVAAELPMQAICLLLGVPESDRHSLFGWVETSFDFRDREAFETTESVAQSGLKMFEYGAELIARKRREPADDMLSVVAHATLPGENPPSLTDEELQLFFSLLFAAGADTTRNAVAGGLLALAGHPEQLAAVRSGAIELETAADEIVRWTSPAAYNRRTATVDATLGDQRIGAGDKVVFWEASANRDERVFADAMRFDAARDPNPHLGFGNGVHHCLGASLARLELRVVLGEVLARFDTIELDGPPEWTRSNKHTGIRKLPVRVAST